MVPVPWPETSTFRTCSTATWPGVTSLGERAGELPLAICLATLHDPPGRNDRRRADTPAGKTAKDRGWVRLKVGLHTARMGLAVRKEHSIHGMFRVAGRRCAFQPGANAWRLPDSPSIRGQVATRPHAVPSRPCRNRPASLQLVIETGRECSTNGPWWTWRRIDPHWRPPFSIRPWLKSSWPGGGVTTAERIAGSTRPAGRSRTLREPRSPRMSPWARARAVRRPGTRASVRP